MIITLRKLFAHDRYLITDEVSKMQLEINAEHNQHNFGTRSINHTIMSTHDETMRQALTLRQL